MDINTSINILIKDIHKHANYRTDYRDYILFQVLNTVRYLQCYEQ